MKKCIAVSVCLPILLVFSLLFTGCAIQNPSSAAKQNVDTLRVGISPNAPPLAFEMGGKLQGLEVDFATQLGNFLGKQVTFVKLDWEDQVPSLEKGKIDIIMSGMTATPKRAYRVDFAKPYLRSGQILLVRRDQAGRYATGIFSLMGNKPKIGVIKGTTGDFFVTQTISKPNLTRFVTSEAAVKALLDETIDAIVHDAPILCYYAAQNEENTIPILQMANEEYLAWAVSKANADLLQKVNAFVDQQAANGILQSTTKHWIPYM